MEWVAISVHIAGDSVTHQVAERCRVRIPEAAGLLALTYAGMALHAQNGSLAGITDSQVEQWAHWQGKRGTFGAAFRALMCDDDGLVTAWEKYNGASIREAKASAERVKKWREQRKAEREQNANGDRSVPRNVRRNERGNETVANGSTVPDLTKPDLTEPVLPKNQEPRTPLDPADAVVGAEGYDDLIPKPPAKARRAEVTWLTPVCDGWEDVSGKGSFRAVAGEAARCFRDICEREPASVVRATVARARRIAKADGKLGMMTVRRIASDWEMLKPGPASWALEDAA